MGCRVVVVLFVTCFLLALEAWTEGILVETTGGGAGTSSNYNSKSVFKKWEGFILLYSLCLEEDFQV